MIHHAKALDVLASLESDSIDVTIADPPYTDHRLQTALMAAEIQLEMARAELALLQVQGRARP